MTKTQEGELDGFKNGNKTKKYREVSELQRIVEGIIDFTNVAHSHIWYADKVSLKVAPTGKAFFDEPVPPEIPLTELPDRALQLILPEEPENISNGPIHHKFRQFRKAMAPYLNMKSRKSLHQISSAYVMPLIFEHRCIGSLMLLKKEKDYFNEYLTSYIAFISPKVASALHHYLRNVEQLIKNTIFESSSNPMILADLNGKIHDVNFSFLKLMDLDTKTEIREKHIRELWLNPDSALKSLEMLHTRGCFREEITAVKKSGVTFDAQLTANIIKDKFMNPLGIWAEWVDISERKNYERQMEDYQKEKEVLVREIQHRVKNNLAVIYDLLYLQSDTTKNPQLIEAIRSSQTRIKLLALLHEKLYDSNNLSHIDASTYIEEIIEYLTLLCLDNGNHIQLDIQADNIPLPIDTAIYCGLIINELVTNAYKHAFMNNMKGEISILFRKEYQNWVKLIVRDNGIGLPEDLDIDSPQSLGLQLVNVFTRELNASLSLKRNEGTQVELCFELKQEEGEE